MKTFLRTLSVIISTSSGVFIVKGEINTGLLLFIIAVLIFLDLKYEDKIK